ncbi:MAG: ubiquinone biosynthesis protein UbiA, partial [Ferruginibacter sp.]|nr:ubiquinone biosynthesis protein UbiA [Ferruginibacter sp.]
MKLLIAFLKLLRWPNLVFIALTQWLFYFIVFFAINHVNPIHFSTFHSHSLLFYLLIFSSVCIAGAGYIINDYFDIQIDAINKPERIVVDQAIKRRWVIVWHLFLSFLGILTSAYVSYKTQKWMIVFINTACVFLLWFYSTHFKRKLIIGNVLIAILTAWVIGVVYFYCGATLIHFNVWNRNVYNYDAKLFYKLTILYSGFAFIVSLIREVVKDMEDMFGDARFNCKTIPI